MDAATQATPAKLMGLEQFKFSINGKTYVVGPEVPPTLTLVQFIRRWANLTGTKILCNEGGCGICVVVVTKYNVENNQLHTFSVNSCQTLVYSCIGWSIETIEHLGGKNNGYHSLQRAVSGFYGTQCGFCTPGFIMTIYSKMKSYGGLTTEKVEKSLDGNLCRCTGYRPILDAFKSMAIDAPSDLRSNYADIEESYKNQCLKNGKKCRKTCPSGTCHLIHKDPLRNPAFRVNEDLSINFGNCIWHRPATLDGLYKVMKETAHLDVIRFVVGNTGAGVYKNDGPYNVYIDINEIKQLNSIEMSVPLIIGANVSIERCIQVFHHISRSSKTYGHLEQIANHWSMIANVAVRNVASWAGNLMLKNEHGEFTSDIFVTLCAVDAVINVGNSDTQTTREIAVADFVTADIRNEVVISMFIPPQENIFMRSYKIGQRSANSHAYINAAFRFQVDRNDNYMLTEQPAIFFGGVRPDFIRATHTEKYLENKPLGHAPIVKAAMKRLFMELRPDTQPNYAGARYRISLCQCLLYKAILDLLGSSADPEYRSGSTILARPISSGKQKYDFNKESWPIGKPIKKLESDLQVTGEALYLDDMPYLPGELHGAFVQTTVARATIDGIDAKDALEIAGVVDIITSKDIEGYNSVGIRDMEKGPDPVFAFPTVSYTGQPIGLIVATSRDIALEAVKLVRVNYKYVQKPTLTIQDVLKREGLKSPPKKDATLESVVTTVDDKPVRSQATHVIKGDLNFGSQFPHAMEPYSALVEPIEDGYNIYVTSQWQKNTQAVLSQVLGIEAHRLNLEGRHLGGSYGGKITRANVVACAAAVASQKLHVPVRVVLPLDVNMTMTGWREPYYSTYEAGIDSDGRFNYVNVTLVGDSGFVSNESSSSAAVHYIPNVYYSDSWRLSSKVVNTDTAANTSCNPSGGVEAIATMENIIEHVAFHLKKDPSHIRENNFFTNSKQNKGILSRNGENLVATKIFPQLKEQTMYDLKRAEIDVFNKEHRWKKRGLGIMPVVFQNTYHSLRYDVQVTIYEHDGSVAISHGGMEVGQGLNTKVAQVAAQILDIPIEYIVVKTTNTFSSANCSSTIGSATTDLCVHGASNICRKLKDNLDAVRESMKETTKKDADWLTVIKECYKRDVLLSDRYWTSINEHPKEYHSFGGAVVEVEIDVLTGEFLIHRTDIIGDCGKSLNPYIDIGQIEGSLIMGFGYFTSEVVKFNKETGEKVSNGTWEYKVPTAYDIPVDFRVSLLEDGDNSNGVFNSKGSKEPAMCLGYCIISALRDAIKSAREDAGDTEWFEMHLPMTVEKIQRLCKVDSEQFKFRKAVTEEESAFKDDFEITDHRNKSEDGACIIN